MWVLPETVLAIHGAQIAEHGGGSGIRDRGLLESALTHPQHLYHYGKPTLSALAAAYAHSIVQNHPFVDGNKRVGYVTAALFLRLNGYSLTATAQDKVETFLQLAAGELPEKGLSSWMEANSSPAE